MKRTKKRKVRIKNKIRFICTLAFLILIIFVCLKIVESFFENINSNNNEIKSEKETSSSVDTEIIQVAQDKKSKQHESKAIKLANGEKSNKSLAVLMYHFFYDDSECDTAPNSNYMPVSSFEEQLKYLNENNYYYPTWDEVADFVDEKIDLPDKSVVLTMDDGDESVFNLALPLLEKYNVPATAFIITSITDENDLKQYENSILDFESHTDNMHRAGGTTGYGGIFPSLSLEEGTEDLKTSIKKLNGNCGALAYPFGDCTEKTKEAAKNAGFKTAFTTVNSKVKPGMDKYELPRVRMFTEITLAGFKYSIKNQ